MPPDPPQNDLPERPEALGLLQAIVDSPADNILWLILADWLEEHDDPRRAELLRLHYWLRATCCEPDRHPERAAQQARLVELLGSGVRPCLPQKIVVLDQGVTMKFAWIPPGTFLMGSPSEEEGRFDDEVLHRVTLTQGFYLGVCPVKQSQWQAVMGNLGGVPPRLSGYRAWPPPWQAPIGSNPSRFKGDDDPVENVAWDDCQVLCAQLGKRAGQRYRLPTEAEWEYACRAGTTTPFWFGPTIGTDQANYNGKHTYGKSEKGDYRERTTPVGSFPANAWGLYDMHGNVSEWCQDWHEARSNDDVKDPVNIYSGRYRGIRGGSWHSGAAACRTAFRLRSEPHYYASGPGCRVCLCLD